MALLNFFKTPKHQKYQYIPRYWNPDKDDLKDRLAKHKEGESDAEAVKTRLAKGFKRGGGGASYKVSSEMRAKANKRANLTLIGVLIFLIIISYVIFKLYVPKWIESIT